jgi:hypothetical protein
VRRSLVAGHMFAELHTHAVDSRSRGLCIGTGTPVSTDHDTWACWRCLRRACRVLRLDAFASQQQNSHSQQCQVPCRRCPPNSDRGPYPGSCLYQAHPSKPLRYIVKAILHQVVHQRHNMARRMLQGLVTGCIELSVAPHVRVSPRTETHWFR